MTQNNRSDADNAYKKGDYEKAIATYNNILQLDPKDALSHQGLAQSFFKVGNLDQAKNECEKAIQLQPLLAIPHLVLGKISARRRDLNQSELEIEKAIELDPNLAEAHLTGAAIKFEKSDYQNAVTMFSKAIELNPQSWLAHYSLGISLQALGKYNEGCKEHGIAFKLKPSFEGALILVYAYILKYRIGLGLLFGLLIVGSLATGYYNLIIPVAIFYLIGSILSYRNGRKSQSISIFLVSIFLLCLYLFFRVLSA